MVEWKLLSVRMKPSEYRALAELAWQQGQGDHRHVTISDVVRELVAREAQQRGIEANSSDVERPEGLGR